ncbi:hypothetical protein FDG2_1882 [Candidatus Protofrankia californiensis]|uniref:Uncharacterized protein n=1 Tax=Candidatus Protofrankia californiensis TaxID=1839754 RepID=A0A1C3NWH6_9ACTN|nr:hypothetical protein FDG2_1882 [Candidatus Protofrankia californiensis]
MAARRRPESAATIACRIAEDVRTLNHVTLPVDGYPGLEYPADVYTVLAGLGAALASLPQALSQLTRFLHAQARRPELYDTGSRFAGRPADAVAAASRALAAADQPLRLAATLLDQAQQDVAGLGIHDMTPGR